MNSISSSLFATALSSFFCRFSAKELFSSSESGTEKGTALRGAFDYTHLYSLFLGEQKSQCLFFFFPSAFPYFSHTVTVFAWSYALLLFEDPAEIVGVAVTGQDTDFLNAERRVAEQLLRMGDPHFCQILDEIFSRFLLEQFAEVIRADIYTS